MHNTSLILTIWRTLWLILAAAGIIAACSWADTGAKHNAERTPSWSLFDENWGGGNQ